MSDPSSTEQPALELQHYNDITVILNPEPAKKHGFQVSQGGGDSVVLKSDMRTYLEMERSGKINIVPPDGSKVAVISQSSMSLLFSAVPVPEKEWVISKFQYRDGTNGGVSFSYGDEVIFVVLHNRNRMYDTQIRGYSFKSRTDVLVEMSKLYLA